MSEAAINVRNGKLVTVNKMTKMAKYSEAFTVASLRALIFNSKSRKGRKGELIPANGLREAGAIIRIGRKVLIDTDAFDNWIHSQGKA